MELTHDDLEPNKNFFSALRMWRGQFGQSGNGIRGIEILGGMMRKCERTMKTL
jgi:hypothetical protein